MQLLFIEQPEKMKLFKLRITLTGSKPITGQHLLLMQEVELKQNENKIFNN